MIAAEPAIPGNGKMPVPFLYGTDGFSQSEGGHIPPAPASRNNQRLLSL